MSQIRADHARHDHQQVDILPHRHRQHVVPLLPRLLRRRLQRLHHRLLCLLQQSRVRRRHHLSLPGDGFDVVIRAKSALELTCRDVVSCANIHFVATRNLIVMTGDPYYSVKLGRKDSFTSIDSSVEGNLPCPTMPMNQIIQIF
ncbi:hypothetical protein ACS0TY_011634 [Phlomoides rotata]